MLVYRYDKEILKNLENYIKQLESESDSYNKIIDLFCHDERLTPIYNKKSNELANQGCVTYLDTISATLNYLLDRINELEKSYSDIKDKTINPAHVIVPIILTEDDVRILNILHQKYHRQIYIYSLCSTIGISEEYVEKFLTKMTELGYCEYLDTKREGWLTSEGIKLVREINNGR